MVARIYEALLKETRKSLMNV